MTGTAKSTAWAAPAAAAALILSAAPAARAQLTYQNDSLASGADGSVQCGFVVDEKFASIFVPEAGDYPFTIDSVLFALLPYRMQGSACMETTPQDEVTALVEIWNDAAASETPDGAPVYTEFWVVPSSMTSLNEVPIGDASTIRIESGVVRVAVTISSLEAMPVSDVDGGTPDSNLVYDVGGTWHWTTDYGLDADWLLRLTATHVPAPPDEAAEPVPDEGSEEDPDAAPDAESEDPLPDVPADADTDADDVGYDPGDDSIGGGGCSCSMAG